MPLKLLTAYCLLLTVVLLLTGPAHATSEITFNWDRSPETDATGYRFYQSTASGSYVYGPSSPNLKGTIPQAPAGSIPAFTLTAMPDGTCFWVVTAFDAKGNESGPSNEISVVLDTTPPASPKNLKQVNIRITVNMKNGQPVITATATTGN